MTSWDQAKSVDLCDKLYIVPTSGSVPGDVCLVRVLHLR